MARTTLDIDATLLKELKRRGRAEGKSLGRVTSELLAAAMSDNDHASPEPLDWTAEPMGARVDLSDKEALNAALDAR